MIAIWRRTPKHVWDNIPKQRSKHHAMDHAGTTYAQRKERKKEETIKG